MSQPLSINSIRPAGIEPLPDSVTVRAATASDAACIRVLARLDDQRQPEGPFLVAELSGEVVAALSIPTGNVVADPFRLTANAVAMLRLRAAQMPAGATVTELRRPSGRAGSRAPRPAAV